jgi:hypothetical protein
MYEEKPRLIAEKASHFSRFLNEPELNQRYQRLRRFFSLRESAYDISSMCQLRCDGCYYFQGDKYKAKPVRDMERWRIFFEAERDRGINYVNLAGAEPALVPDILKLCNATIPLGTVFTNGLRPIDPSITYRIHISIWGGAQGDPQYRKRLNGKPGEYCLPIQLQNYRGDKRIIFVYTFNGANTDQIDEVLDAVTSEGHKLTFNIFSAPKGSATRLRTKQLDQIRRKMLDAMARYPRTVVYSHYNVKVHTAPDSLYSDWGCPYPRAATETTRKFGLTSTFRSYRVDMTHHAESDCCVPDTDCRDCRHYAAGSAIITSRLRQHCETEELFRGWLDYVDTYLAIWIPGYERGRDLYRPA